MLAQYAAHNVAEVENAGDYSAGRFPFRFNKSSKHETTGGYSDYHKRYRIRRFFIFLVAKIFKILLTHWFLLPWGFSANVLPSVVCLFLFFVVLQSI